MVQGDLGYAPPESATRDRSRSPVMAALPQLQRVGLHSERGELTLEQILTTTTNHLSHHVKFIRAKRQALGLAS